LLQRTQGVARAQASSFCFAILRQKAKLAVDLLSCGLIFVGQHLKKSFAIS
jgi:hypothetical protein